MNRRALALLIGVGLGLLLLPLPGCIRRPTLHILMWEGNAEPAFIAPFERQCHCKVKASFFDASDELVAKLQADPGAYDVFVASSDVATTLAVTGQAEALDLGRLPTYTQLSQALRDLRLVKWHGKVHGVPFVWGSNPLLYDPTVFPTPPESWTVLWDPRYRGKVSLWDDLSSVYLAAQVLGYHQDDPAILYNLNDEQLDRVREKLFELRPNVHKVWSSVPDLAAMFERHEVVLAMGWTLITNRLRKAHVPIGETIPKENTTGWIDHLMISSASRKKDLAYQFIEYMIQARTQKLVTDADGAIPANPRAAAFMTTEEQRNLHLDDIEEYQRHIYFWEDVPRRRKYDELWSSVKAGLTPVQASAQAAAQVPARTAAPAAPPAMGQGSAAGGEVFMLASTSQQAWLTAAAAAFRALHPEIPVRLQVAGSIDGARAILDGKVRPSVFSPADSIVLGMLAEEWHTRRGGELYARDGEDAPQPLALTPLVYVAWQDRAGVLTRDAKDGAAGGGLSWPMLHRLATAPKGWAAIGGRPEWGDLKLGQPDPACTSAGWQTVLLAALDYHHKKTVDVDDLLDRGLREWLGEIEEQVVADNSTSDVMMDMIRFGPSKYDVAVVYENLAISQIGYAPGRWQQPLRVYYPPATVWSDNPVALLQADWVGEAERQAARAWVAYLRSRPAQELALAFGFRPADPSIPLAIPLATPLASPGGAAARGTSVSGRERGEGGSVSPFTRLAAYGIRVELPPVVRGIDGKLVRTLMSMGQQP
ncbi:MAG TPA: extracellular solute-binding protein [Polyangia bacterium]|nr:extracellular solute-binding protein [Polyangia bacterium]